VASFVETEQVLVVPAQDRIDAYSFVQMRGSIPVFWSRAPDIAHTYKPRLTATKKRNVRAPPVCVCRVSCVAHRTTRTRTHNRRRRSRRTRTSRGRHYSLHVLINLINRKTPDT
jgi:hypothetical protein